MITLPEGFKAGFGRRMKGADPATFPAYAHDDPAAILALEDLQRGELSFELISDSKQTSYYLVNRYVTRVRMDNAAPLALGGSEDLRAGQVLVFLDIPEEVVPSDDYRILVRRYVRDESDGKFVYEPMESYGIEILGWGSSEGVTHGIPISIADRVIGCTPGEPCNPDLDLVELDPLTMTTWGRDVNNMEGWIADDMEDLIPFPALQMRIRSDPGLEAPAALEMEISYPLAKFAITGVYAWRNQSNRTLISWDAGDQTVSECTPEPGLLKLVVLDPDRGLQRLAIAFDLRGENFYCAGGRATVDDFLVGSLRAYDQDGAEIEPLIDRFDEQM